MMGPLRSVLSAFCVTEYVAEDEGKVFYAVLALFLFVKMATTERVGALDM